jgi:uncharacterized DUF497 family protein
MEFRWHAWNLGHIGEHGIRRADAEEVIEAAAPPYPLYRGDERWMVWGRSRSGRYLQVIFVLDPDGTTYVIHARSLTEREKRTFRRRWKQ